MYNISIAPHLRAENTTKSIMRDVAIATIPILLFGFYRFGLPAILVTLLCVVSSVLFDKVMFGFDSAKLFYIISDKKEEIAQRLLNEIHAGVTILTASGGYTHSHKDVLMVAIKKHLYPKIKSIVKEEDPEAFFIVSQANEIYGKGFKENDNKKQA